MYSLLKNSFHVIWMLFLFGGCSERQSVNTTPPDNSFTYAIKGRPAVFHRAPRPGTTDYVAPDGADVNRFAAEIRQVEGDDSLSVGFNLPPLDDVPRIEFTFTLASQREGFTFDEKSVNRVTMIEFQNTPVESPTVWLSDESLKNLTHQFIVEYASETNVYHGQFNFVMCSALAILANVCDRPENQRQVFGHFNIRADKVTISRDPVAGNAAAPVMLGTAPVIWREAGVKSENDSFFFRSVKERYNDFSVHVEAGRRYWVEARSSIDPKSVTELVPFEVFDDAEFIRSLCVSNRTAFGNRCGAIPSADTLFIRVDRRQVKTSGYFKLYAYRDMTDFPVVQPEGLQEGALPTPATENIAGVVNAWLQVHYLNAVPGQLYTVSLSSPFGDDFPIGDFDIFDGAVAVNQTYRDNATRFANGEPRVRPVISSLSICTSHANNPVCVVKPANDVLTVVLRMQPWAGDMPYRLQWSALSSRAIDQGKESAPIAVGTQISGTVGNGKSYYQTLVEPSKTYFVQTSPVPYFDLSGAADYRYDMNLITFTQPEVKFYSGGNFAAANLLKSCGRACLLEPSDTKLAISVSEPAHLLSYGMAFNLSMAEVPDSLTSEKKILNLSDFPYNGSVGARGSEYTLVLTPSAKYRVQIDQPAGPYDNVDFAVTDPGDINYYFCRGSYEIFKRLGCVFQMPRGNRTKVLLRVNSKVETVPTPFRVGSPITVSVIPADDASVAANEGEDYPQIVALNQPYRGHAGVRGSRYKFNVQPRHFYRVLLQGITAGAEFTLEQTPKRCSFQTMPGRHALPECLVATDERQTEVYFTVKAQGAQESKFTIRVEEDIR